MAIIKVFGQPSDPYNYRHYFFSCYYFLIFCLFVYYVRVSISTQRKTVIIFPSNFDNSVIEKTFRQKNPKIFYLHEPVKNFTSASYYSAFFDYLFSCELHKIQAHKLWNLSSNSLEASRFASSTKFLPKTDEVITKLKHRCIKTRDIVVSFTDKSMKKYILDYHFLSEVSRRHDLSLVLIVQPPIVGSVAISGTDSEQYCQYALDRIEEFQSLTTFKHKFVYMASIDYIDNILDSVLRGIPYIYDSHMRRDGQFFSQQSNYRRQSDGRYSFDNVDYMFNYDSQPSGGSSPTGIIGVNCISFLSYFDQLYDYSDR